MPNNGTFLPLWLIFLKTAIFSKNPSLEMKFISAGKLGDKLTAKVKVQKKTNTLVFLTCEISNDESIIAVTSGVWKILKSYLL